MTDTPVVERPFPVSGLQIQLRVVDARQDLVFSTVIGNDCDDSSLHELIDRMTRAVDREKLKARAVDLRDQLRRNRELLTTGKFDKDIAALQRQRADLDKIHAVRFVAGNRRGEHKPSTRQVTELAKFDQQIEMIAKARADLIQGLPITEYQLACLEAQIAGQPEPAMPEEVEIALMSIELPEEVSFSQGKVA
jgi:hypothetical protein